MTSISIPYVIGGLVEGVSIANVFYGISIAQAYVYMKHCDRDPRWTRWLAATVIFLETGNTIFLQRQQFFYSVLAIENPRLIAKIDWSMPTAIIFEILSEIVVQMFYLHRMWLFSKNMLLTVGTTVLLIFRHGIFLYCISDTMRYNAWLELEAAPAFKPSLIATVTIVIISDSIIAMTMAYYLHRNQSQLRRTRGIVSWLILYFINTGAILVAFSVCILTSYLVAPDSLLFTAFILLYARAVANSLFGALNARHALRAKMQEPITLCRTSLYSGSAAPYEAHSVRFDIEQLGNLAADDPKATPDSCEHRLRTIESVPLQTACVLPTTTL